MGMFLIFDPDWRPLPNRDRCTKTTADRDRDRALGPGADVPAGCAEADGGERPDPPEAGSLDDDGIAGSPERDGRPNPVALADEITARPDEPELGLA